MGPTPLRGRQVCPDHARVTAETGGAVGIWYFFPSLDRYVEGLKEMADVVGVDHVSIGTDQHVTPGSVPDYTQWVHLVAAIWVDLSLILRFLTFSTISAESGRSLVEIAGREFDPNQTFEFTSL